MKVAKTNKPKVSIDPKERRLTTRQAAPLLNLSERKVKEKCAAGLILATKPGKSWEIPESAIPAYLNSRAN